MSKLVFVGVDSFLVGIEQTMSTTKMERPNIRVQSPPRNDLMNCISANYCLRLLHTIVVRTSKKFAVISATVPGKAHICLSGSSCLKS